MYIDELFQKFFHHLDLLSCDNKDYAFFDSLFVTLNSNIFLTQAQANLLVKMLKKYSHVLDELQVDYDKIIQDNLWSKKFRVLDTTRAIWVEHFEKESNFCLKFPYSFLSTYKEYLKNQGIDSYTYDRDKGYNILNIYDANAIPLLEFCSKNSFTIDDSFLEIVSYTEEVWNNEESIVPYSYCEDGNVCLANAVSDAQDYFKNNKKDIFDFDLLLAKGMGFDYKINSLEPTLVEKVSSSQTNFFRCKNLKDFFTIFNIINDITVIILDRHNDEFEWLRNFIKQADESNVDRQQIKVCFRDSGTSNLNTWIKENRLGGKIDSGKIFIFRAKPAKWLYSKDVSVKIVATTSSFPLAPYSAQLWLESHPFVFYLSDMNVSISKGKKIVDL